MPDNDRIPGKPRRHWRRPCGALIGGQDPLVVGHEIDRALAATLRERPLDPPRRLAEEMCEAARKGLPLDSALHQYGRKAGIDPLTSQVAAEASTMFELAGPSLGYRSESDVLTELVTGALRRFAESCLCGPDEVGKAMVDEGLSFVEVRHRQRACLEAAQYEQTASQILSESGSPVRTPRSRIPRLSTAELLEQRL